MTVPVWEDCGKPEELLQTNRYLLGQLAAQGRIAQRQYADSVIIQPAAIDPSAAIRRSVVGPNVSIGAGATLDGVVIENSIVGDQASLSSITLADSIVSAGAGMEGTVLRLNLGAGSSATPPPASSPEGR
jgi:glucose-1-phosphate thymidylyltransferase